MFQPFDPEQPSPSPQPGTVGEKGGKKKVLTLRAKKKKEKRGRRRRDRPSQSSFFNQVLRGGEEVPVFSCSTPSPGEGGGWVKKVSPLTDQMSYRRRGGGT